MGRNWVALGFRLILALLLSNGPAWASDALILIKPENAGPNVSAGMESHPSWVLWPAGLPPQTDNGLLSVLTGLDWQGNLKYFQFKSADRSQWVSEGYEDLVDAGYLPQRSLYLGGRTTYLIADRFGNSSQDALLLAISQGHPTVSADTWPAIRQPQSLVIFQAHSWDDAAFVSRRCGGKSLVVEFPPSEGTRWSRFWMFGNRWPSSSVPSSPELGLGGIVAARDLLKTVIDPDSLNWSSEKTAPHSWLVRARSVSPMIRAVYLAAVLAALAFGGYLVRTETSSKLYRGVILLLLGAPSIDLLTGAICSRVGLAAGDVVAPTLGCCLLGGIGLATLRYRRRSDRQEASLLFIAGAGLLACLISSPVTSDYSPILVGSAQPTSFEFLGFLGAYSVGVLVPIRYWNLRIGVVLLVVAVMFAKFSNVSFEEAAVGPLALVATLPLTWFGVVAISILPALGHSKVDHFCWTPFGLLGSRSDLGGFDLSAYLVAILSPALASCVAVASMIGISTIGFAQHRLVAAFRQCPVCCPLGRLALYMLCAAIIIPGMLASALTVVLGCALVLVYAATA